MNTILLSPTTLPQASPLDYVEAAIAAGYEEIGLRLNRSPGYPFQQVAGDKKLIGEIKRRLDDANVNVFDIYSFYLVPDTNVDDFLPAIDLAPEFGAQYLVVMGADPEWSRMRDNLARLCDAAAARGLACTIEPAVIRPLANLAQTLRLITEAGRRNATICIDPLNFARAGDSVADLRRLDPRLLPYAQITDGVVGPDEPNPALLGRMSPNERRLLGQGDAPLDDIYDALPPGLRLSIEQPPPAASTLSAAEWAKLCLEDARAYLTRYYGRR